MQTIHELQSSVPSRIRQRGEKYWEEGRVSLFGGSEDAVWYEVSGTEDYRVILRADPQSGAIACSCTCPYFEDRLSVCKHVWAALLEAEETEALLADVEVAPPQVPERVTDDWRAYLEEVIDLQPALPPAQQPWLQDRRLIYALALRPSRWQGSTTFELFYRKRKKDGEWSRLKSANLKRDTADLLPDPEDRWLLAAISGAETGTGAGWYGDDLPRQFILPATVLKPWVRRAAETGRLLALDSGTNDEFPLTWDDGPPWELEVEVTAGEKILEVRGRLTREGEGRELEEALHCSEDGVVFFPDSVAPLEAGEAFAWIPMLRRAGALRIPAAQTPAFLGALATLPKPPALNLPPELRYEEVKGEPHPQLEIRKPRGWRPYGSSGLEGLLSFRYAGESIPWKDPRRGIYHPDPPRFLLRDAAAEGEAFERLRDLGAREAPIYRYGGAVALPRLRISEARLPKLVLTLTREGWRVEAEGRLYRNARDLDLRVASGVDWFDLEGTASFGDRSVELPRLLEALARGQDTVILDDGTLGVLPETWVDKLKPLAGMGSTGEEGLRFRHTQIGLVDALLTAQPEITFDQAVARARQKLGSFSGVKPRAAPRTFKTELRDYQKEGLGWLHFLRRFGFGGCLADDMGLGKTVQVLALLESRRQLRHSSSTPAEKRPGPTLVVVPKSLLFNWQRESERFTPRLRVLVYAGPRRRQELEHIGDHDLVLTTYGTLRRDIARLKDVAFDYVVLDEAQAIKNYKSATAKSASLLTAAHRLALTGTPLENHVGELMSILDFLNPGLFGPSRRLEVPKAVRDSALDEDGAPHPQLELIAGAVRPFILRRTKAQVAKDLPEKVQQILYCELPPAQRKDYNQLRRHYQRLLLKKVESQGLARSKMHVLEALLRLRQASCHPGLIDPRRRREEGSAKLSVLLEKLEEILEEGHKALVFSQFTSLLAIVRESLDARGIPYEYLDGKTRKREERVRHFQEDPHCPLFLISLKAGGLGLNLTAAEYVFLLDPWWNPAVEAQAVDRTHRIGQTRPVFAYSLIARDTVEEKVLQLQQSKRELAEAIVRADTSLLRSLTKEELAELLS